MLDLHLRLMEQYKSSANCGRAACPHFQQDLDARWQKKGQVGKLVNGPLENSWPEPMVSTTNPEADATAWSCALTRRLAVDHQDIGHFCELDAGRILLDLLEELPESHLAPAERQSGR